MEYNFPGGVHGLSRFASAPSLQATSRFAPTGSRDTSGAHNSAALATSHPVSSGTQSSGTRLMPDGRDGFDAFLRERCREQAAPYATASAKPSLVHDRIVRFVEDVTIPDKTVMHPRSSFNKQWKFKFERYLYVAPANQ